MTTLHLGVTDIPYATDEARKVKGKKVQVKTMTTGDVAEILENKYHVMELFFEEHSDFIVGEIEKSLAGAIENVAMGAPPGDPFGAGTQIIDEMFKKFVTEGAVEKLGIPGTPTKAALKGVSHRWKHPYSSENPRRPSFVDTGLYVDNFISWID